MRGVAQACARQGVWMLLALALASCAVKPPPSPTQADRVVVRKGERTLELYHGKRLLRTYRVNLGKAPRGHKMQEGDQRTPEGEYVLNWRNPNSRFHKAIHISYPNARDRELARVLGVNPGGLIMIHGRPNRIVPPATPDDYARIDWTDGCIAVSNEAMDEIWNLVPDGTPIRILP